MDRAAADYCAQYLRLHDPDRYLLSLFARSESLPALWALYSFAHEVAKTRDVVTETRLGLIRLQWWRDAIGAVYEGSIVPDHQILRILAPVIRQHALPRDLFDAIVYAHEFDLEDQVPATFDGLRNYADFTTTPLLRLASRIDTGHEDVEGLRAVATDYGLAKILLNVKRHALQRRCYLPLDMLGRAGIGPYDIYDGSAAAKVPSVVLAILEKRNTVVRVASVLDVHRHLAEMHFQRMKKLKGDIFSAMLDRPHPFKEVRLWWRNKVKI
jgi:NADH dehydrogenase [ubiquinone] 1 alpha subcomplex assembly factor 6